MKRIHTAHVLFGLTMLFGVGCKDDAAPADEQSETCNAPLIPIYTSPGCGQEVRPMCLGGAGACAGSACGCDGKVITTCNGYSSQKYQFVIGPDAGSCKPVQAQ